MNTSANVLMRLVWIVCIDIGCLLLAGAVAASAGVCGRWWGASWFLVECAILVRCIIFVSHLRCRLSLLPWMCLPLTCTLAAAGAVHC